MLTSVLHVVCLAGKVLPVRNRLASLVLVVFLHHGSGGNVGRVDVSPSFKETTPDLAHDVVHNVVLEAVRDVAHDAVRLDLVRGRYNVKHRQKDEVHRGHQQDRVAQE